MVPAKPPQGSNSRDVTRFGTSLTMTLCPVSVILVNDNRQWTLLGLRRQGPSVRLYLTQSAPSLGSVSMTNSLYVLPSTSEKVTFLWSILTFGGGWTFTVKPALVGGELPSLAVATISGAAMLV